MVAQKIEINKSRKEHQRLKVIATSNIIGYQREIYGYNVYIYIFIFYILILLDAFYIAFMAQFLRDSTVKERENSYLLRQNGMGGNDRNKEGIGFFKSEG